MVSHVGTLVVCGTCLVAILCGLSSAQSKPTIILDKLVTKLYQYESNMKQLFKASCKTDPSDQLCSIRILYVRPFNSPCDKCFIVLPGCDGNADDHCVWFLPGQGSFNPSVDSQYLITLEADDGSESSERLVDVRITTNSPPYFPSGRWSLSVDITNSEKTRAGSDLTTVNAKDDDGDSLIFTMTTEPNVKDIVINSRSGDIYTTKDLKMMCLTAVTCYIYVQDPYNHPVGPFLLDLYFEDNNVPPIITNVAVDFYLREDEALDRAFFHFTSFDDNQYPDIVYSFSAVPPEMNDFFYIANSNLKLRQAVDYETHPHIVTMNLQANDGFCDSEVYSLIIRIMDVNEPPVLLPIEQTVTSCEGRVDILPVWNVSDPDYGDSWTFTDVQPNDFGRFKIHGDSGKISTALNYDLDEARHPSTVVLIVTVSDRQHQTATATVTVRFIDCNDNAPVFPKASKIVPVTPCDTIGTIISGVPKASDADSDYRQNNVITYSGSGGLVSVNLDGNIVLEGAFHQGQYVTFPVYATDKGEHPGPLTGENPVWISVYAEACKVRATTQSVTTAGSSANTTLAPNASALWDENEVWIIVAGLLAGVLVLLSLLMCVRYGWSRCRQSCRGPPSEKSKVRGHRQKNRKRNRRAH